MIRIVTIIILIYVGYRILNWALRSLASGPADARIDRGQRKHDINEMVKDPVCGKYVLAWEARRARLNGKDYYFCSDECQKRFLAKS
ncbi:MAG: YHS domain-containing protein [Pseudomonadota bacterium]